MALATDSGPARANAVASIIPCRSRAPSAPDSSTAVLKNGVSIGGATALQRTRWALATHSRIPRLRRRTAQRTYAPNGRAREGNLSTIGTYGVP
jgi:hypothetical protein